MDRFTALVADLDRWSRRHRVPRVARRATAGFLEHDGLQYAGSMAYFGVLSIFQLLVLGVVVFSFFLGEGEARAFVLDQVAAGSPLDPEVVGEVIDAVIEARGEISIISGAFLLWGALGLFGSLSTGIGRAFEAAEPRPFIQDKLLGLLLMAITGVLAVTSLLIGIVTGVIQEMAGDVLDAVPGGGAALAAIGLVVPFVLILIAFLVIYRVVPNRRVAFATVWPGAVVAAILWTVLRFGFTWYATSVARYDSAFGPISTGVTLLVFLYLASVIVLLGAEVARANVVDAELTRAVTDAPRGPTVPEVTAIPAVPIPPRRRGLPRWALVAGAALVGVVAGRLTKRDEDE